MIKTKRSGQGIIFQVKVVAGASREKIAGEMRGMLRVGISAPREKGKANRALVRFLAKALDVKRGDIEIIGGERATIKTILARGLAEEKIKSLVE
ncbi:MAG: DUF167 domain-containing protein [Planctomycetota bacterium]